MENILIIAGEISGDIHGGRLVKEILRKNNRIKFFGIGGDSMQSAGVELLYHIRDVSFLGFVEVIKHIPFLRKVKKQLQSELVKRDVEKIILIDYPGFNLSFAKSISSRNKKIFYYISPQIWAWGKNRIKLIKKIIHKMIVVFPFEEKLYKEHSIDAKFVGHPLLESINEYNFMSKNEFFAKYGLNPQKKLLVIFPGSRKQEIEKILPVSLEAAKKLRSEFDLEVTVAAVNNVDAKIYPNTILSETKIISHRNYELLKYSDLGIIKSGTSTLEAAIFRLPFVVVYKISFWSYLLGKSLIKIDSIALANIVSSKKVVQEFIQNDASAENIYSELKRILTDENYRKNIIEEFEEIKGKLGEYGASGKAANIILGLV